MQLYYYSAKKYKTPTPEDTGATPKYDIRELRIRPEKLAKRYQDQDKEANATKAQQDNAHQQKSDNSTHEWTI